MQAAQRSMSQSQERWKTLKREIETERKEALLKVKDEIYRRRNEFELEIKRDRLELERHQNKVNTKYETLEKKEAQLDELKREVQQKERKLSRMSEVMYTNEEKLKNLYNELITKLENVSGFSKDQAKRELSSTLQAEVELSNQKWIQKVEEVRGEKLMHVTLAEGEVTGHAHRVTVGRAELYEDSGTLYLRCKTECVVTHEEHNPITIPAGDYKIGIVREYDYITEEARRVAD